jgi:hypothetical protein
MRPRPNTKNSINLEEEKDNDGLLSKTKTDMENPDGNEMVIMRMM